MSAIAPAKEIHVPPMRASCKAPNPWCTQACSQVWNRHCAHLWPRSSPHPPHHLWTKCCTELNAALQMYACRASPDTQDKPSMAQTQAIAPTMETTTTLRAQPLAPRARCTQAGNCNAWNRRRAPLCAYATASHWTTCCIEFDLKVLVSSSSGFFILPRQARVATPKQRGCRACIMCC